jgi:hypothetical protein
MSPAGFEPALLIIDILLQLLYFVFETSGNIQLPSDRLISNTTNSKCIFLILLHMKTFISIAFILFCI